MLLLIAKPPIDIAKPPIDIAEPLINSVGRILITKSAPGRQGRIRVQDSISRF